MRRWNSIRGRDVARAALWLVLAVALGGAVLSGLPALAGLIAPPETMPQSPSRDVSLPIRFATRDTQYAPQVLTPVSAHAIPEWLQQRIQLPRIVEAAATPAHLPAIAIVIDDLGADAAAARRAIDLPKDVNLSFLPYPGDTPQLAREAVSHGHQILVHVPMEPEGREDPGPNALLTKLNRAEILRRFDWALSRVPGYSGINNHMGSRFTQDRAALVPVMERLANAHVFFLDSRTTPNSAVVPMARIFGVPSAARDVFLDDTETPDAIAAQLAATQARARSEGIAIAIGHPHAVTLDMLELWTARVQSLGFQLVTVSEAIRIKSEREAQKISASR